MEKTSPAINKINFLLFINLLALIVIVNVSAISLNSELGSLDASLDNLTDDMRRYTESYPTVHLVEFSDLKNTENADLQTQTPPLANKNSSKSKTPTQGKIEENQRQNQSGRDVPMAEKPADKNIKGFMIDQVAIFIIATPLIAFFLLVNHTVGVGIIRLIKFFH